MIIGNGHLDLLAGLGHGQAALGAVIEKGKLELVAVSQRLMKDEVIDSELLTEIIDKQGQLIGSLEQENTGLKKEVKRQKRKKAVAWIVAGIAGASHLLR